VLTDEEFAAAKSKLLGSWTDGLAGLTGASSPARRLAVPRPPPRPRRPLGYDPYAVTRRPTSGWSTDRALDHGYARLRQRV